MRGRNFLSGRLLVEITSADTVGLLNSCRNICLHGVNYRDDLTFCLEVSHNDYKALLKIAEKQGACVKIVSRFGLHWTLLGLLKRPVLVVFMAFLLCVSLFLPSRILFVSVEGNATVPTNEILEAASACGIKFGAMRRQVRSEKMKNALLQTLPKLQWAGINTSGCTAVISVKEKTVKEHKEKSENCVSSIVAARDGIVQSITVYEGNPLSKVGQAVKAGQTLVSGYTDCGIVIRATQANAEIKAITFRELELISIDPTAIRGNNKQETTKYSLRIGKKLIKFYKDSGNLDRTCGKIYSEEYIQLPGGFVLPVAVIKETCIYWEESYDMQLLQDQEDWLGEFAKTYLQSIMISGEILTAQTEQSSIEGACMFYGKYACMEMIGQVKYEQSIEKGGKHD